MSDATFRSGFVALVGRPNVGKSTLLNALCKKKLAITTPVAQTTRRRLSVPINFDNAQLVLVDTPGLHKPQDALGAELNKSALLSLDDADIVLMLIDATQSVGKGDVWVAKHVQQASAPYKLLLVTKADISDEKEMKAQISAACELADFNDVLAVSAKENFNMDILSSLLIRHLPEGPLWFPKDIQSDMTDDDIVAEFIREKAFLALKQEVPHSLAVHTDSIEWKDDTHASIFASILVERESQKGIVIGAGASMLKRIGIGARKDIEKFFGAKIYLKLKVECQPLWRRDKNEIRRLGFIADE